ncbi:hypothetical protein I3W98_36910, partial [Streptomyces cavourensis]|nr:hypothetical protein [Streptomyces cavourensis]
MTNQPPAPDPAAAAELPTESPEITRPDTQLPGTERPRTAKRITLRSDLRASWLDGLVALLVTAAVFVLLYIRIRNKTSSTVSVMPFMADVGGFWMYFLSQAFGWSALLWA